MGNSDATVTVLPAAAVLLPYLLRQGRDSEPGTSQPGIGVRGATLHIDRLDGGANRLDGGVGSGQVPAQPQGEISLQRVPGEAPHFACIVHVSLTCLSRIQAAWPTGSATGSSATCSRSLG